ncbi:Uncharacterized protein dnm_053230 [Desulfonema magnum]|uniref:Uncharacterized protein n=1 Tax=Desulfonema magnum TaxID=45655 RepID=A0A975BPI7_9BACT|nr:Uncharacterized protein dnm_053230 [Desulfonema magnum]
MNQKSKVSSFVVSAGHGSLYEKGVRCQVSGVRKNYKFSMDRKVSGTKGVQK